ncbi:MAG TPA: transglycosylase domain-containing protein [Clostridia bacterium]|nr:transglycosylase domain-containing protein [Clostridia bacterium]
MNKWKEWLGRLPWMKSKPDHPIEDSPEEQDEDKQKGFSMKNLFIWRKRQPNFILSVFVTTIRLFFILLLLVGFAGFGAVIGIGKAYLDSTPELDVVQIQDQNETTFIYDKFGNLITEYYGFENRVWAPIDEMPETLKKAFISIEDIRFESHNGIDIKRVFGSVIHNLSNNSVQGASTLTQQVIKNTILTQEVSYKRKIQEMYLAIQLEKNYSKDQIMEAYLNTIWMGGSNYGVKTAAKDYFDKELSDLTLRESAMLAGITRNPWRYDPRMNTYSRNEPEFSYDRTNLVLDRMYENEKITEAEYENARIDPANYNNHPIRIVENPEKNDYPMKYFIERVIEDVRDRIMLLNGWEGDDGRRQAEQFIYSGGLEIYTTLDPAIQISVEEAVYNYSNLPKFNKKYGNSAYTSKQGAEQPQAAAVVIDQHTGQLQAIVGGKQPPTAKRQYNRAFHKDAKLTLGSSIKPLSVYGPFIEAGYPGGIIIENIPAAIEGWVGAASGLPYPRNYGDGPASYEGPTSVRRGISKSYNVVAARLILDRVGPEYSADKLRELGISTNSKDNSELPASLALGTYGYNMIEIAGAYATIANRGVYQEPISFTRIVDKNGKELINAENDQINRIVFKESTTFILTEWMKDVVSGGTTTVRLKNNNGQNIPVAGKTGTTSDFKDVYFGGFTPYYTATVWIGHDDFDPQFADGTQGGRFAAPLWKDIMEGLHGDLESKDFYDEPPEDVVRFTVCGISGKRPNGELCAKDLGGHGLVTEWFPKGAIPGPDDICDMHVKIEACPYSGKPPTPYCPKEALSNASAILLPKNSPYRQLSDGELAKYLPGAVKDLSKIGSLDYSNPNDRAFFCPLHTEEWFNGEQQRVAVTTHASELIAQVRANMANPKYKDRLTKKQIDQLNKSILKLEEALKQGIADVPSKPIEELPVLDVDIVQVEMDSLAKVNKDIFTAIEEEIEKENQIPDTPVDPPVDPPNGGNEGTPGDNGNGNSNGNGNN